jgi:hypothetical protein
MKENTKREFAQLGTTTRELLVCIISMGYTCKDIERMIDHRVSYRTLYRWLNGETNPKRKKDVEVLGKLYAKLRKGKESGS